MKIELQPGEFEVFSCSARLGLKSGRLVFTNQRFIWRPSFKHRVVETDVLRIEHERVAKLDVVRPWQTLFLEQAVRLSLQSGERHHLHFKEIESTVPIIRRYMSQERYRPGDLFQS